MDLPNAEDVLARLKGEKPIEADPQQKLTIDFHALMHAALMKALNARQARLAQPRRLRYGHLAIGINPYKGRHVIGRVKRAQYKNASKGKRVYVRSHHGGHF